MAAWIQSDCTRATGGCQCYRQLPEEKMRGELFGLRATASEHQGMPWGRGGGIARPLGFGETAPELQAVARGGVAW